MGDRFEFVANADTVENASLWLTRFLSGDIRHDTISFRSSAGPEDQRLEIAAVNDNDNDNKEIRGVRELQLSVSGTSDNAVWRGLDKALVWFRGLKAVEIDHSPEMIQSETVADLYASVSKMRDGPKRLTIPCLRDEGGVAALRSILMENKAVTHTFIRFEREEMEDKFDLSWLTDESIRHYIRNLVLDMTVVEDDVDDGTPFLDWIATLSSLPNLEELYIMIPHQLFAYEVLDMIEHLDELKPLCSFGFWCADAGSMEFQQVHFDRMRKALTRCTGLKSFYMPVADDEEKGFKLDMKLLILLREGPSIPAGLFPELLMDYYNGQHELYRAAVRHASLNRRYQLLRKFVDPLLVHCAETNKNTQIEDTSGKRKRDDQEDVGKEAAEGGEAE